MNGPYAMYRRGRVLIGVLLAVVLASVIGVAAYNAGVSHGLAVQVPAAAPGVYPYPHYWHPWGFGFFFPLLFGFLLLRLVFWGGHRRWYGRGYYGGGYYGRGCYGGGYGDVPAAFDEWHRRAHQHGPEDPPPASSV